MELPLSRADIRTILPHREPFLFVDRITEIVEAKRITGEFTVKPDEFFLFKHVEPPQFPAPLVAEAMAQVGAILVLFPKENRGRTIYFRSIDTAEFETRAMVGDRIQVEAVVRRLRSRLGSLEVKATIRERPLAKGVMGFALG